MSEATVSTSAIHFQPMNIHTHQKTSVKFDNHRLQWVGWLSSNQAFQTLNSLINQLISH